MAGRSSRIRGSWVAGGVAVLGLGVGFSLTSGASASLVAGRAVPHRDLSSITSTALAYAARAGDARPTSAVVVVADERAAVRLLSAGDEVPGSGDVFVVVMTGHFQLGQIGPPGSAPVTGTDLAVTVNPSTYGIEDAMVDNLNLPDLVARLGPTTTLSTPGPSGGS